MRDQIKDLVENFTEGYITKDELELKIQFVCANEVEKVKSEILNTSRNEISPTENMFSAQPDCEISLDKVETLVAPADLTLTGQALWYQEKLEEVSPLWQYTKFVFGQVQSAWTILHGRKHDIERKLVDVQVLRPTKGTGNGTKRGPGKASKAGASKGFSAQISALNISSEEKEKLRKLLGL